MNTMSDLSFSELNALLQCIDQYDKSGAPHAGEWRESVFTELRRRFAQFDEAKKTMDAARAARNQA